MNENSTSRQVEEHFFLDNFNADIIFNTIERADYLFLHMISEHALEGGRVYLSDLAGAMNLPISSVSNVMQRLQDKGFVQWKTDHSEGRSYVALTNKATDLMQEERDRMHACYVRIREEIDPQELEQTIRTMKKISDIMKSAV